MTEATDPWKDLSPPAQSSTASGRRVDPELQWGLFWAVDVDGSCLLILQHAPENRPRNKLPNLRGLGIETRLPQGGGHALLVIRLRDNEQREIFHRLCLDIIAATRLARSEQEAIERFLARTWRWHRLLRGGRDERLSDEEQKGLIGELRVMQQHLFPSIGIEAAIRSWTGPLDAPKDFEVGRVCIEVKARRGAATPFVSISTEHQLDTTGIDALFLNVAEVTGTSEDDPKGLTMTDVVLSILDEIQEHYPSVVELFEERLLAVGFDWADDYSDRKWLMGADHLFEVVGDFPRITPDMYPAGVTSVRYSIALQDCEAFRTDHARMTSLLAGGTNGDQR
tara:strand:- start:2416 stop:3429 length:1014 start_codon:yes stop_codon:yes gene_type:complete